MPLDYKKHLQTASHVARRPACQQALLTLAMALALGATPLSSYLEEQLYLRPMMRLMATFGMQAKLPEEVRIVAADDSSIKALGRHPTFGEWVSLADTFLRLGYERILIQEPQDLSQSVGRPSMPEPGGLIAVGVGPANPAVNERAIPARDIHDSLTLAPPTAHAETWPKAHGIIGPAVEAFEFIDRIGNTSVDTGSSIRLGQGFQLDDGGLVPHLSFWAAARLFWQDGGLHTETAALKPGADQALYMEYVLLRESMAQSIPIKAFLRQGQIDGRAKLSPAVEKRLQGGRIAVFVPSAYTGSRYLESPIEGIVPAYISLLSAVTAVVKGDFIRQPIAHSFIGLLAAALLTFLSAAVTSYRRFLVAASLLALGWGGLVVGCFIGPRLYLPYVLPMLLWAASVLLRSAHHFLATYFSRPS